MSGDSVREGAALETLIDNAGLQLKAVAIEAKVSPAKLSRHVSGVQVLKVVEVIDYGRAIERLTNPNLKGRVA